MCMPGLEVALVTEVCNGLSLKPSSQVRADPRAGASARGGQSGKKGSWGPKCPASPQLARHSGPSKPAAQLGILALTPSTLAPPFCPPLPPPPTPHASPAQAGCSNGLLALSPSSLLKYLSDHYVFSGQDGEWKEQEAGLLWPDARVNYRSDKSPPPLTPPPLKS